MRGIEAEDTGSGWEEGQDLRDSRGEAIESGREVRSVDEAGGEVAGVGGVAAEKIFGVFVEFEELVLCDAWVEPGEAREGGGGGSAGEDDAKPLIQAAPASRGGSGVIAAVLEPEDTDGEDAVDGGLGLGGVDGDDGPGLLATGEGSAGVGGAEGALEVHGGAETFGAFAGEGPNEGTLEQVEVAVPGGVAGAGRAEMLVGGELECLGTGLPEALGGEAEGMGAGGDGEDAADEVAVVGPEMEGGAIVGGVEGVAGFAEVEEGPAVFEQEGVGVFGEEAFDGGGDVGGRLGYGFGA